MGIHPGQIERDSPLLTKVLEFFVDAPGNSVDKIVDELVPGFAFQVKKVEIHPKSTTASIDYDVRIAGTSVLDSVVADPTAEEITEPTLASAVADKRGDETEALQVNVNTDAGGDGVAVVRVFVRPWPAGGDPQ